MGSTAPPTLQPVQNTAIIALPPTGNAADVAGLISLDIYSSQVEFLSGAADQVAFVYNRLGGNVLDIEIEPRNVYEAYLQATLEYSRIINSHQARNVLSSFLGATTATFDSDGEFKAGGLSSSLSGSNPASMYPRFRFSYSRRVADAFSEAAGIRGTKTHYSASFQPIPDKQEYDLQQIVANLANASGSSEEFTQEYLDADNKRICIERVYYKSPATFWRFFGYYGGLTVVGNLNTYGQYTDDSTFEVVPAWQNKLQALAFETNLYTRASHYSYEIKNNKLFMYPPPIDFASGAQPRRIWFRFTFENEDPYSEPGGDEGSFGLNGVNNYNTLPFANLNFCNINSMGKHWIRLYALAICKRILSWTRGKFTTIPIPNNDVTLNWSELLSNSTDEMDKLREELIAWLDELTMQKLMEVDADISDNSNKVQEKIPISIFIG